MAQESEERVDKIDIMNVDSEELYIEIKGKRQLKVIIFGAGWCRNCPVLLKRVIEECTKGKMAPIKFYKIDADLLPEIGDIYSAKALPFSVFLNEGSEVVATYAGIDIEQFLIRANLLLQSDNAVASTMLTTIAPARQPVIPDLKVHALYKELEQSGFPQNPVSFSNVSFANALSFEFLHEVGLAHVPFCANDMINLNSAVSDSFSLSRPASQYSSAELAKLYSYPQPTVSPDGTCSNVHEMALKVFNLATDAYMIDDIELCGDVSSTYSASSTDSSASTLGPLHINGRSFDSKRLAEHSATLRLWRLQALVQQIFALTKADWIGIYRMSFARDSVSCPLAMSEPAVGAVAGGDANDTALALAAKAAGGATGCEIVAPSTGKNGMDTDNSNLGSGITDELSAASVIRGQTSAGSCGIADTSKSVFGEPYPVLLKESYLGEPSRAVFPVTEAFALNSTNSWVGLNGKARLIPNTNSRGGDVSYYKCSGSVQSELCVPILQKVRNRESLKLHHQVVGIIDLESWNLDHFTPRMIAEVLKIGLDLGSIEFGIETVECASLKESASTASWELGSGNGDGL